MSPKQLEGRNANILVWGKDHIETGTLEQVFRTTTLPKDMLGGHIALMPDAHVGKGSTVGSVIPTEGAIIPAAIGVDIGCGMAAIRTNVAFTDLPDLTPLMPLIERAIPAGVGQGHGKGGPEEVHVFGAIGENETVKKRQLSAKAISQCGTLGSGNHFFELCVDEDGIVWIVLHSGSRGVGNQLAQGHIKGAKKLMEKYFIELVDPDLAYLVQGTPEFSAYITDMKWAQDYAMLNRQTMLQNAWSAFRGFMVNNGMQQVDILTTINCHHNFTQMENHHGRNMWITRKGAIKAGYGDLGIIPGSMGTDTYIVSGLGNPASYSSCSHGAGRNFSRTKANQMFSSDDLTAAMGTRVWNSDRAESLVDEIPGAYKDIHAVMAAQSDLVETVARLHQIFNYKG